MPLAIRTKNLLLAGGLVGFVAGVYRYTYAAMKTNELEELSAELDDVRKAQQALQSTAAQHAPVAK